MSTSLAKIVGRKEDPLLSQKTTYSDNFLYVTRFCGGEKNGEMLQLTIYDDKEGGSYTQLTKEQVKELIKILSEAL